MSDRFFKRSKNIDVLTDEEINDFLVKEKIKGKVEEGRVRDFYNMLSTLVANGEPELVEDVDYEQFGCKTEDQKIAIDKLRRQEVKFLNGITPDVISTERVLKAAAALSYKFEKDLYGGRDDQPGDPNTYLRKLFMYHEDQDIPDNPATFGDLLDIDMNFLNYLALLNTKRAFLKPSGKRVKLPTGKKVAYTQMESMSEIANIDLLQTVMPSFSKKLATKELWVKSRYDLVDKGQNLIILVDDSGSMSKQIKKAMVKAALTLKIRDWSEAHNIYIGTFETNVYGFQKVDSSTKFDSLTRLRFSAGGTDVNGCIKATIANIRKKQLPMYNGDHYKLSDDHYEILVINDGQDTVDARYHPTIKLHSLCLMQQNKALRDICHRSGGTYHYLSGVEDE